MALTMKLPNLDMVGKNKTNPRYLRRIPKGVQQILGQEWFQVHLKHKTGAKMLAEYDAIARGFDKLVDESRVTLRGDEDTRSPMERWHSALLKAE
ncbi:hypothetical protein [Falsiphaeobacter marinintestinus]|uniref:hypothetical protein n=1 Tax=Falsiphaeobacter marinintestinus TaxID=1492905 RepID=UPI0011B59325|nr:hypothetical protein [Phaeobacter marinintestinus]